MKNLSLDLKLLETEEDLDRLQKGVIYASATKPFLVITEQNKKYSEEYKLLEEILVRKR